LNEERTITPELARQARDIYTVSRLNRETQSLLEREIGTIWIGGELSNLARPRSGHWYFSIKDNAAQTRCAMFKSRNRLLKFEPREGMQIIARARVSMYEPRGEFQLLIEHMELAGEGLLHLKLEQLKRKLAAEGLFDPQRKKDLPVWPHRIGVVTSPSGAAIRDVLTVLRRRNPAIDVVVFPVAVQGANAAPEIARAIGRANAAQVCDVLIVGRGGGSIEDLWAFNEELVARAIYASEIPVVSAVGHEIDFTIADLVADVRAATPSASAEICSPDRAQALGSLDLLANRLYKTVSTKHRASVERLKHLQARLQHPGRKLEQYHQRIDELLQRLPISVATGLHVRKSALSALSARIQACNPRHRIVHSNTLVAELRRRLNSSMTSQLDAIRAVLDENVRALKAVSPQATLERGYAILSSSDGAIARDAETVCAGEQLSATLARGRLLVTVDEVVPALVDDVSDEQRDHNDGDPQQT
jgi:exodeoxyribonuclease VII large subunit